MYTCMYVTYGMYDYILFSIAIIISYNDLLSILYNIYYI